MASRDSKDENAPKPSSDGRKGAQLKRREQALRENLKRRKEQERARKPVPKSPE